MPLDRLPTASFEGVIDDRAPSGRAGWGRPVVRTERLTVVVAGNGHWMLACCDATHRLGGGVVQLARAETVDKTWHVGIGGEDQFGKMRVEVGWKWLGGVRWPAGTAKLRMVRCVPRGSGW